MRLFLPTVWFALAAWFLFGSSAKRDDVLGEVPRTPDVAASAIDPRPLRTPLGDPPRVRIGGIAQKCSDCHALFASLDETPGDLRQHGHITLDHGLNDRCFNCHSQADRNSLVLRDGELATFDRAPELCAQCHGTLYRDWARGMHGKTVGAWDPRADEHRRLLCIECHDPHAPAFGAFETLPGPNTWRMGHPATEVEDEASERNPLERWKTLRQGAARREEATR